MAETVAGASSGDIPEHWPSPLPFASELVACGGSRVGLASSDGYVRCVWVSGRAGFPVLPRVWSSRGGCGCASSGRWSRCCSQASTRVRTYFFNRSRRRTPAHGERGYEQDECELDDAGKE